MIWVAANLFSSLSTYKLKAIETETWLDEFKKIIIKNKMKALSVSKA